MWAQLGYSFYLLDLRAFLAQAKLQSLVNTGIRVLLFPAYFLRFLWELPSRVVIHEPKGYRSPRRRRKNRDGAVANAVRSGGKPSAS